jgi:P-type Ca2+ transporter type 2C
LSSAIAVLATIGSAVLLVQIAPLAKLLHLSPLHADDWLIAGLSGAIVASLAAFIPSLEGKLRSRPE